MAKLVMAGHDPETVLNKPVGVRAFLFAAALKQAEEEQNSPAENSGMEGR